MTVVDLTTSYAGPTASMCLADLGATVTKIERPGAGDDCRYWGPPFIDGVSPWFASTNRNKRSVALNLRHPSGGKVLQELIADADVFMQNVNPAKLVDLEIDPDSLCTRFPRLVYCAMSGFGLTGPNSAEPGYDLVAQARSGLMSVTGERGRRPQRVSTALSDIVTGMCAALAISAARVRQVLSGEGDLIDVSLMDADLALMAPRIASYLAGEPEPAPSGGTDSVLAVYQTFQTADRDLVVAVGNDRMWQRFCMALDLPDLAADPELSDNAGRRTHRLSGILPVVSDRLRKRSAAEWMKILAEAEIPVSLVRTLSEVVADPHVQERGALIPLPRHKGLFGVHSPFRLGSMAEPRVEPVPALGEHTRATLQGLGYAEREIARLAQEGAIQCVEEGS